MNSNSMNLDSTALMNIFSSASIINPQSGYGNSGKVKGSYVNLLKPKLSNEELLSLMEDNLIRRIVEIYPVDGVQSWFSVHLSEEDVTPGNIINYIDNINNDFDSDTDLDTTNIRSGFMECGIISRIYGKSYMILGIDDGLDLSMPVAYDRIKSVNWCVACTPIELRPEWDNESIKPKKYTTQSGGEIHHSRVLSFYGSKKFGGKGRDKYDGVSVIQLMFDSYNDWIIGLSASSEMLAQYDVFTLGIKGLGQMVMRDVQSGTMEGQRRILSRAQSINTGISQVNGLLYDLENELPGTVSRSYSGADAILETLEKRFIASCGLPRFKLLNEKQSGGLSDNGISQRYEWAKCLQNWVNNNWRHNFSTLVKLIMLSKDSPTKGKPIEFKVNANFDLELTNKEKMELEKLAAERSKMLIDMGAVSPSEIRASYESGNFDINISLESKPPKTMSLDNDGLGLDDGEWEALSTVSAADWVKVASEIAKESVDRA